MFLGIKSKKTNVKEVRKQWVHITNKLNAIHVRSDDLLTVEGNMKQGPCDEIKVGQGS